MISIKIHKNSSTFQNGARNYIKFHDSSITQQTNKKKGMQHNLYIIDVQDIYI